MIEVAHVFKNYKSVQALADLTLQLHAGSSIALIGPNGSGKSTLMKCVLGLVKPSTGTIFVQNRPIDGSEIYRQCIGYMPQIIRFPENMTVGQLFSMMRDWRKNANNLDEELFDAYQIQQLFKRPLGGLSGGMKQKVNAALSFLFNPEILILDEPTAGLDPLSAEILKHKIRKEKEKGKLILISSHIMADLEEIASHVVFLIDGKLAFYKTIEALKSETNAENLSKSIAQFMTDNQLVYEAR